MRKSPKFLPEVRERAVRLAPRQNSCRADKTRRGGEDVARYGKKYKDRVVARLLPPESASVERDSVA